MEAVIIFLSVRRLKWPGEFELDLNKRGGDKMRLLFEVSPAPLLKSGLGPLASYCTYQETLSGRPELVYLPFDQDWNDMERGHCLSRTRIYASGPKCGHYSSYPMDNY